MNMTESQTKILTIDEVSERLTVSPATVRRLISDGRLKAIKIRGQLRIRESDLMDYLESL